MRSVQLPPSPPHTRLLINLGLGTRARGQMSPTAGPLGNSTLGGHKKAQELLGHQ